ncbi:MAG: thymidylate synthase [Marinibacterium sp.]
MSRMIVAALASAATLSACSGNPFPGGGGGTPVDPSAGIPTDIAGTVDNISYDAANQVLVIEGQELDNTPYSATYVRKPALDRQGYEAYTSQESSLGRHHTAYVKEIDGARAAIVMAGGQFGNVFAGGSYGRTGAFSRPDVTQPGGIVQYAGGYVGLLNASGDGGDLLPVAPGTDPSIAPTQAAEVTGNILIAGDFADNSVEGIVYNRAAPDLPTLVLDDLEIFPGTVEDDGSFTGDVTQNGGTVVVGTYGGVFTGQGASAVAGSLYAADHIQSVSNEFEHGLFVLSACGTPNADPVCNQPVP